MSLSFLLITLAQGGLAFAHDPGLSSANITIGKDEVGVVMTFNGRDLTGFGAEARSLASRAVALEFDAKPQTARNASVSLLDNQNIEFRWSYARLPHAKQLTFNSTLLTGLPFGHRQAVAVANESGKEVARRLLSGSESSAIFGLEEAAVETPASHTFLDFLLLGIRHILAGYDHLLFLSGLLIMCRRLRTAAVLITCFTIAHSITLALSTFELVWLPGRIVEPLIAASIVYVGLENFLVGEGKLRARWLLTFVFGLVHGLGFAIVLRDLGVGRNGLGAIVPLVGFNLGVEVGQLSVAAILLPLIWKMRQSLTLTRVAVPAFSLIVALAGGYWLIERTILA